jgi:hypothetical protein
MLSGRRNLAQENRFGGSELERVDEESWSEWNKRDEEFLVSRGCSFLLGLSSIGLGSLLFSAMLLFYLGTVADSS